MAKYIIVAYAIICTLSLPLASAEDSEPSGLDASDDAMFDRYKEQVCGLVPQFKGSDEGGPQWTQQLITEDEILELAFVNMAYGLTSDSITHLKEKLGWKKTVIDMISVITKKTCSDNVLSEMFVNAAKNLFLYYLVKLERTMASSNATMEDDDNVKDMKKKEWDGILDSLNSCAAEVDPIDIATSCGKATTFIGKDGIPYPIEEAMERADQEVVENADVGMDVIIDTVWWMFSTTYARCYSYFYPNEDIILLFFQKFREDFLSDFYKRWRDAGPMTEHFDIVFGPFDYSTAAMNCRKCCSAAYQYETLAERQLVRPFTVLLDNVSVRNFKVDTVIA